MSTKEKRAALKEPPPPKPAKAPLSPARKAAPAGAARDPLTSAKEQLDQVVTTNHEKAIAVRRVKLSSLALDPDNARKHDKKNLDAIKGSLTSFGQVEPLVVQKSTRVVLGGNGRLTAMRALGWTHADVVDVDLDQARARALGLALNRTAELAAWDPAVLAKTLTELSDGFIDLAAIGFSDDDLAAWITPTEERASSSSVKGSKELDEEGFQAFEHACPKCGFEFDGE